MLTSYTALKSMIRVFTQSCDVMLNGFLSPLGMHFLQFMKWYKTMLRLQSAHYTRASTSRPRINELAVPAQIGKPES